MYSRNYYTKFEFEGETSEIYEASVQQYLNLIKTFRELESKGKITFDLSDSNGGHIWIHTNDIELAEQYGFEKFCNDCGDILDLREICECTDFEDDEDGTDEEE